MFKELTDDLVGNTLHGRLCRERDYGERSGQRTALLATYRDINVTAGHTMSHMVGIMVNSGPLSQLERGDTITRIAS